MAQKKPRQKPLKLKDIQKTYAKMNTYKTHILNEEDNTVIKYYEIFDNKKIEELLKQLFNSLQFDNEHKINFFNEDEKLIQYVMFLILKNFTNLDKEIPEELDAQIPIFNQIISVGLFEEMFNNVFPPEQVSIVLERIGTFANLANQAALIQSEIRQNISESVQSPVIKKKLEEGLFDAKV